MSKSKTNNTTKVAKSPATGVHPQQHPIEVVMTDGSKFNITSTWGKEGDVLRLDLDPKNHPAWHDKAQNFINSNNERVTKFKSKFGNFDFVAKTDAA